MKQKIYTAYLNVINSRIKALEDVLADLKESGANETKSTAGDKHETALAMLQIEQTNVRAQLKEAQLQKEQLQKISPEISTSTIILGSLIKTNRGYFFMSTALGKIQVDEITIMAVSPQSPLGQQLLGKSQSDIVAFRDLKYTIEKVE